MAFDSWNEQMANNDWKVTKNLGTPCVATMDDPSMLSDELVPLCEPGELKPSDMAKEVKAPAEPSEQERRWHELTHCPYQPWCSVCVRGRGRDDPHRKQTQIEEKVPDVQIDYFFLKTQAEEKVVPCLSAVDSVYGRTMAVQCEQKGRGDKYAVKSLENFCRSLGFEKFTLTEDPENATGDVAVNEKLPAAIPCATPKGSKGFLGRAERLHGTVEGLMRTFRVAIGDHYKVQIPITHPIVSWMVRHAAWIHDRYQTGMDGRTAYFRHMLRDYKSGLVPFGESVVWRMLGPIKHKLQENWGFGIWLGRDNLHDCHILGTRHGTTLARSIRRLPPSERYDKQLLLAMRGRPSNLQPSKEETAKEETEQAPEQQGAASSGLSQTTEERREAFRQQIAGDPDPGLPATTQAEEAAAPPKGAEEVPEQMEPPSKRPRGRPPTRILPDSGSSDYTPGCAGCRGESYYHTTECWKRRGVLPTYHDRELVKLARHIEKEDREDKKERQRQDEAGRDVDMHQDKESQEAASRGGEPQGKRAKTSEDVVMNLYHNHEMSDCGMVVTVGEEKLQTADEENEQVCYYWGEDTREWLEPSEVKAGIDRETGLMQELDVYERQPRSAASGQKVWSGRWCHRRKGDGVRSRYVV